MASRNSEEDFLRMDAQLLTEFGRPDHAEARGDLRKNFSGVAEVAELNGGTEATGTTILLNGGNLAQSA